MRRTPVLFGTAAVGLGVGAWTAGAPAYMLLLTAAIAATVCATVSLSIWLRRDSDRQIMIEILKVEMLQDLNSRRDQILDLDRVHAVPVKIGDVETLVGVMEGTDVADAVVLRLPMERARKGVAS